MKALFLAGGFGTRLKPLTDKTPKPMVPIMGKPLLERNIMKLKKYGIKEFVLSVHYKPYEIKQYFGDGSKFGVKIHYVKEDIPLGTGGAIKNAEKYFDDSFLIFNSDIIDEIDYKKLINYHKEKSADATIAVTRVKDPSMYGVIEYDKDNYVTSFKEKPKKDEIKSHYINAGVYIFEPKVLDEIASDKVISIERDTFPTLLKKHYKISIYGESSYWMDIGTPAKYLRVHRDILEGKYRIDGLNFSNHGIIKGKNINIKSTANILGPVYIGDNVSIGDYCDIGPNTVIGSNCKVGQNSKIYNSLVWNNVFIGNNNIINGSIITSKCILQGENKCTNTICTEENNGKMVI
ncbi:MAG: NDP-sugar synthase [Clostridium sp.]|nr:NDP-sugar synthase [Clostridium sp.]